MPETIQHMSFFHLCPFAVCLHFFSFFQDIIKGSWEILRLDRKSLFQWNLPTLNCNISTVWLFHSFSFLWDKLFHMGAGLISMTMTWKLVFCHRYYCTWGKWGFSPERSQLDGLARVHWITVKNSCVQILVHFLSLNFGFFPTLTFVFLFVSIFRCDLGDIYGSAY